MCGTLAFALAAPAFAHDGEDNEKYRSMEAACAAGDPACDAPVVEAPDTAMYNGRKVTARELRNLRDRGRPVHCVQEGDGDLDCYDDTEKLEKRNPEARAARRRARRRAQSSYHIGCEWLSYLVLWSGGSYTGNEWHLYSRNAWYNVSSTLDNDASSYSMGNQSGHLAEGYGGAGYWYPGNTTCGGHQDINSHYPQWNNRISSAYRD